MDEESLVESFVAQGDGRLARVMEDVFNADGGERVENDLDGTNEWCDSDIETEENWNTSPKLKLPETEGSKITTPWPDTAGVIFASTS